MRRRRDGNGAYLELNCVALGVHPDLQLHVLDQGLEDAVPVLAEGRVAVARDWDSPVLVFLACQVGNLDLVELDFVVVVSLLLHGFHLR